MEFENYFLFSKVEALGRWNQQTLLKLDGRCTYVIIKLLCIMKMAIYKGCLQFKMPLCIGHRYQGSQLQLLKRDLLGLMFHYITSQISARYLVIFYIVLCLNFLFLKKMHDSSILLVKFLDPNWILWKVLKLWQNVVGAQWRILWRY